LGVLKGLGGYIEGGESILEEVENFKGRETRKKEP